MLDINNIIPLQTKTNPMLPYILTNQIIHLGTDYTHFHDNYNCCITAQYSIMLSLEGLISTKKQRN